MQELARGLGAARITWAELPDAFLDRLRDLEVAIGDVGAQLEGLGAGAGTANCARRAGALVAGLADLRAASDDEGLRWAEAGQGGITLQFTPFEIAARLREFVESRPCAWVFTSATLAIGEDFSHFAARIGLPQFFVLGSSALRSIVLLRPRTVAQLRTISGIGPDKIEKFGNSILEICSMKISNQ